MDLKYDVIKDSNNEMVLHIKGDEKTVNALRKTMIARVPVLAIDTITMHKNTTVLSDELLKKHIGLIPMRNSDQSNDLTLDVIADKDGVIVASKDIESTVKPVYDNIIIVKLKKGQHLHFTAKARVDCGNTNAKFCPVVAPRYEKNGDIFVFTFETTGSMSCRELLKKAIELM